MIRRCLPGNCDRLEQTFPDQVFLDVSGIDAAETSSRGATLQEMAARIELLTGCQTSRAFQPKAGHRSVPMLMGG